MRDQVRLNQLQEDEQVREWVAQEDVFVLKQAKKKAEIRVKEGRAKPIDWLTVTLRVIDPTRNPLDDEIADSELDVVDPDGVFEGLSQSQLQDLEKDIETFVKLETNAQNRDFWQVTLLPSDIRRHCADGGTLLQTMKIICRDRQKTSAPEGRALSSVAADINKLLSPKTYEQLQALEVQVKRKLNSNEPIDTDYWEELLRSLTVWKARARLRNVYQAVIGERVHELRKQQKEEAESVKAKLAPLAPVVGESEQQLDSTVPSEFEGLDPDPLLQVRPEDKGLEIMDESAFLRQVVSLLSNLESTVYMSNKCRPVSVRRFSAWGTCPCGSGRPRNQPRLSSTQLRAVHLRPLCLVDSLNSPMMISRKQPRRSMRGSWPRE